MICVSMVDSSIEGLSRPISSKETGFPASPMIDRKKHRRKKSMNQKGDAQIGQAEGKSFYGICHRYTHFRVDDVKPNMSIMFSRIVQIAVQNKEIKRTFM